MGPGDETASLETEPHYSTASTFEMRSQTASRRSGTLKSQSRGTMRSVSSRKYQSKSHHGTLRTGAEKRDTGTTHRGFTMQAGTRMPPRPAPGLVRYSDDDSASPRGGGGYDGNPDDSDSLTEKPSDISSTESQVCDLFLFATGMWVNFRTNMGINWVHIVYDLS